MSRTDSRLARPSAYTATCRLSDTTMPQAVGSSPHYMATVALNVVVICSAANQQHLPLPVGAFTSISVNNMPAA